MRIYKLLMIGAAMLTLAGCTVATDPYVQVVKDAVSETVFTPTGEMYSGCIGMYLVCSQPIYGPSFSAPLTTDVRVVCSDFVRLATKLGAVAYETIGASAFGLPEDKSEVIDLCITGLGNPLQNADGLPLYQGLNLFDDGKKDSFGKVYSLSRGASKFGESFNLEISLSKDLNRVGYITYANEKPKLLTQADLDRAILQNQTAAETMKIANPLLGKSEEAAIAVIEEAGYTWVVVDRDQKQFAYDQTYDPSRIRLTIRAGTIYDAIAG